MESICFYCSQKHLFLKASVSENICYESFGKQLFWKSAVLETAASENSCFLKTAVMSHLLSSVSWETVVCAKWSARLPPSLTHSLHPSRERGGGRKGCLRNICWLIGWFPNLTRAYDNKGGCPRQKFVIGISQLLLFIRRNSW